MARKARPHFSAAKRYAKAVASGKKLAGEMERLACQRFLDDLARDDLVFRPEKAEAPCKFMTKFKHVKGRWASRQEYFEIEPWQAFVFCGIFGFYWPDGRRRVREAYLRIGRKNSKSTMAAVIGLYMFAADDEYGAEVYCGAKTERQAWEVFRPAQQMAQQSEAFRRHYGVEVNAKNMNTPEDYSRFEPVVGNPGDGPSPHCSIVDEFHEHKDWTQYNTFETGMGARDNPLMLVITTAGTNIGSPCYEKDNDCKQILRGVVKDDSVFAVIYAADDDDDWTSVAAMKKANPNLGVSVNRDYLDRQLAKAKRSPSAASAYRTKNLNQWVNAGNAFLNSLKWAECGNSKLKLDDFEGKPCIFGVDLASRVDMVAVLRLFFEEVDGTLNFTLFPRFFVPENRLDQDDDFFHPSYPTWHELGAFETHEDDEIDFGKLIDAVRDEAQRFQPFEIAYDPWRATGMEQTLTNEGFTMVKIAQTIANFAGPMSELEGAHLSGPPRLVHDNNPVMNWMAGNLLAIEDRNGNKKPSREIPKNKIDGMVALLMAMNRAIAMGDQTSSYNRGAVPLVLT